MLLHASGNAAPESAQAVSSIKVFRFGWSFTSSLSRGCFTVIERRECALRPRAYVRECGDSCPRRDSCPAQLLARFQLKPNTKERRSSPSNPPIHRMLNQECRRRPQDNHCRRRIETRSCTRSSRTTIRRRRTRTLRTSPFGGCHCTARRRSWRAHCNLRIGGPTASRSRKIRRSPLLRRTAGADRARRLGRFHNRSARCSERSRRFGRTRRKQRR
jgi:hypothetical protein